ncbi:hypothetical protein BDU57DRAFT_537935 [Ampelomyces quisqualis]|uniref:RING-type domain-containing protein n=1 Tax=Ampelomyces quisqualis TaxID=50730 RepID=A0A6A5QSJ7_AMPQU|nr:hypothetical protein BDU57DRAFT_537935 [Ampelomyces quisqualis]
MSNTNQTPALRSRLEFYIMSINPTDPIPDSECSICTEAMVTDVVRIATCGHTFHVACILSWLQGNERRNRTCPNCRTELYEAEPVLQASAAGSGYDITVSSAARTRYATYVMLRLARLNEVNHPSLRFRSNIPPTSVQARGARGREAWSAPITPFSQAVTPASPPRNIRTRNNPYRPESRSLAQLRAQQAAHQEFRRELEALGGTPSAGSYRDWSQTQTRDPANVAQAPVPQTVPLTWLNTVNVMTHNDIDGRPSQANQAHPVVQRTMLRSRAADRTRIAGLETHQNRRSNEIAQGNAAAVVDNTEIAAILRARQPEE